MVLRAILVDDEQKGIDALTLLIKMFIKDIKIVAHSKNASEGIELIENYKPDIVFLDIHMPEMNGFELLEKLSWKDFNLVFTTAHQEYALKALKNNAVDYLLKPIDHEELEVAINRIRKKLIKPDEVENFNYFNLLNTINQANKRILINSRTGVESIDPDEILYLESKSNYSNIHLCDSRIILSSKSLKEFDAQLCVSDGRFMRVHHSFIVNLKKVSRYIKTTDHILMNNDQKIPLSKTRKEDFFKWMNL